MKYLLAICFLVFACSPVTNEYYSYDGGPGLEGPLGMPGPEGASGDAGIDGHDGDSGPQGSIGPQGNPGPKGDAGSDGQDGTDGADGADGQNGINGQDGDAGPQGPQGLPGIDAPRWVLMDADEVEVNAIVEPFRFIGDPRFGSTGFDCVLVEYVDQQYYGIAYDLQTGDPGPCTKETTRTFYYLTSDCDIPYSIDSFEEIQKVDDVMYLAETSPTVIAQNYYIIVGGECVYEEGSSPLPLCKFEELPANVLNVLNNPPYTLIAIY
jgi:hypothetical protein